MIDRSGRNIDYLRISITDRCNLRCRYCMPESGVEPLAHDDILRLEEVLSLCESFTALGICKFKITGGEPLVRWNAVSFIKKLKAMPGVEQVTITTNGLELAQALPDFQQCHLDGINLSLDTLDAETFRQLTRRDGLDKALQALDLAAASNIPLKINCVPIQGVNDQELPHIAELAREKVQAVRFIELMPIGLAAQYQGIPADRIREQLAAVFGPLREDNGKIGNGPAHYYAIEGFKGKIGFIDALSHCFCQQCNRLRLTADGTLKLCLAHDNGVDLKTPLRAGASKEELQTIISEAVLNKPAHHAFSEHPEETEGKGMYRIGG